MLLRTIVFLAVTVILASAIFATSYHLISEVTVESTGYTARARGLFNWIEQYAEYDEMDPNLRLKNSGNRVRPFALAAEIGTCCTAALLVALVGSLALFMVVPRPGGYLTALKSFVRGRPWRRNPNLWESCRVA